MKVINFLVYIDLEIIEIEVSIGLTGIKKCLYSSFNFLINYLMGKLMPRKLSTIYILPNLLEQ